MRGGGENGRDARQRLGGPILGDGERGNSPWNVLHGGGQSSGGERRGGHHPEVVATDSWLREKSGAQVVLTVALAGQSRRQRCWATVVHTCPRRRLRILSPMPLLCQRVRAGPCLRKGWRPLRSWTGHSRHDSSEEQGRALGVT
jgi:hypothetical protein